MRLNMVLSTKERLPPESLALQGGEEVSQLISDLVELAIAEKDHSTFNMLQWFVKEQVEEEESFDEIVEKLRMAKDNNMILLMIDRELGERKFGGGE